jgi:hypothetical protein
MLMRFVKLSRENKTVEDITLILSAGIDDDASGPTVIPSGTKLQRALEIFRRSITILSVDMILWIVKRKRCP